LFIPVAPDRERRDVALIKNLEELHQSSLVIATGIGLVYEVAG
jgi:hypothetical protein